MDKAELLNSITSGRAEWDSLVARLDDARLVQPGAVGEWSVKDLIAHLAWTERETAGLLESRAVVGSDWWYLPLDERNARIYAANRDRPLDEVRREARQVFERLVALIEGLSQEELDDSTRLGWPPEWIPWQVLARNTFMHYRAHLPELRAWVEQSAV